MQEKLNLKIKYIVLQHIAVISIGIAIFYIDEVEFIDSFYPKLILLVVALAKSIYFLGHSFKKIEDASLNNHTYSKFLTVILTNIFLIIISFSVDYTCLFMVDRNAFVGIISDYSLYTIFYDFTYYSVMTFATVGGDIIPITKSAKFLVIIEVIVAFITTIVVITNFVHIKDSIHDMRFLKIKKKTANKEKESQPSDQGGYKLN